MHDQLRDMGRMIVETDKEYAGTRIWKLSMIPSQTGLAHDKVWRKENNLIRWIFEKCNYKYVGERLFVLELV
jgi:hypothetical protein